MNEIMAGGTAWRQPYPVRATPVYARLSRLSGRRRPERALFLDIGAVGQAERVTERGLASKGFLQPSRMYSLGRRCDRSGHRRDGLWRHGVAYTVWWDRSSIRLWSGAVSKRGLQHHLMYLRHGGQLGPALLFPASRYIEPLKPLPRVRDIDENVVQDRTTNPVPGVLVCSGASPPSRRGRARPQPKDRESADRRLLITLAGRGLCQSLVAAGVVTQTRLNPDGRTIAVSFAHIQT